MEKKKYIKPAMQVYELQRPTMILCGSPLPGDIPIGYASGIGGDEKHLA